MLNLISSRSNSRVRLVQQIKKK